MAATSDGVPCGSVDEQREWFWLNFSQELERAKAGLATDAERERFNHLRNRVLWLHNAIWRIHSIRPNAQPDDLNVAATDLLLQYKKFALIPRDDLARLAAVHEQGFAASLAGLRRASFGMLCKDLALWHVQKLKEHRRGLSPLTPDTKTSQSAHLIDVQEGRCFFNRPDLRTSTNDSIADCSPDDVQKINAAFDANRHFNFASHVAAGDSNKAGSKRKPVSQEDADNLARKIARSERSFRSGSQREWSKRLKIAAGRVGKLPFWIELHPKSETDTEAPKPKAVAMTHRLESSLGKDDAELARLMNEQDDDDEGSPLDSIPRRKRSRRPSV